MAIRQAPELEIELATFELESPADTIETTYNSAFLGLADTMALPVVELASFDLSSQPGPTASADSQPAESAAISPTWAKPKKRDYYTHFFGIPAKGRRFVYILDMSTSMRERNIFGISRFQVAATELLRAVDALDEDQSFLVTAFCYRSLFFTPNPTNPALMPATAENKQRLRLWVNRLRLGPGTDPRLGVVSGLRLKPDAIFLLSDGEFNGRKKNRQRIPGNVATEQLILLNRNAKTPIHTIAFDADETHVRLAAIAKATGGIYRFVRN